MDTLNKYRNIILGDKVKYVSPNNPNIYYAVKDVPGRVISFTDSLLRVRFENGLTFLCSPWNVVKRGLITKLYNE